MLFLANNLKASICCFSLFYRCFCNFQKEQSPQGAPQGGEGGGSNWTKKVVLFRQVGYS